MLLLRMAFNNNRAIGLFSSREFHKNTYILKYIKSDANSQPWSYLVNLQETFSITHITSLHVLKLDTFWKENIGRN